MGATSQDVSYAWDGLGVGLAMSGRWPSSHPIPLSVYESVKFLFLFLFSLSISWERGLRYCSHNSLQSDQATENICSHCLKWIYPLWVRGAQLHSVDCSLGEQFLNVITTFSNDLIRRPYFDISFLLTFIYIESNCFFASLTLFSSRFLSFGLTSTTLIFMD